MKWKLWRLKWTIRSHCMYFGFLMSDCIWLFRAYRLLLIVRSMSKASIKEYGDVFLELDETKTQVETLVGDIKDSIKEDLSLFGI